MNAKTLVPLVIALVLGVVAAKLGRDMLLKRRAEEAKVRLIRVVLASEDLTPGSVIGEEHLGVTSLPADGAGPGIAQNSFSKPADVVGRVTVTQILRGQPILETLLAPKGSGVGAQAMIPQGMRAATVEVNEFNGVAGLLVPGCFVDVVHTIKFKDREREDDSPDGSMVARTIVENLRVLAVGRRTGTGGKAPAQGEAEQAARSVTLLVTQEQAELIDLATHIGQPRLVLRNGLDKRVVGGKGITLAEFKRQGGGKSAKSDPLAVLTRLLGSNPPPTTRPVDWGNPRTNPDAGDPQTPVAAFNWRDVEVIRAGNRSTVRVAAPPAEVTGTQDKTDEAYPNSGRYDD
jgi:pilus assembly protein CpaB